MFIEFGKNLPNGPIAERMLIRTDRIICIKEELKDKGIVVIVKTNEPFYFESEDYLSAKAKLAGDKNFIQVKTNNGRYLINLNYIASVEDMSDLKDYKTEIHIEEFLKVYSLEDYDEIKKRILQQL